jgi:DnaJ-class molecular chaperone
MAPKTLTKKEARAVLGISYPTTKRDAKVAFMNLVRENHEDKGGDKEKNQIASISWCAYEVR